MCTHHLHIICIKICQNHVIIYSIEWAIIFYYFVFGLFIWNILLKESVENLQQLQKKKKWGSQKVYRLYTVYPKSRSCIFRNDGSIMVKVLYTHTAGMLVCGARTHFALQYATIRYTHEHGLIFIIFSEQTTKQHAEKIKLIFEQNLGYILHLYSKPSFTLIYEMVTVSQKLSTIKENNNLERTYPYDVNSKLLSTKDFRDIRV